MERIIAFCGLVCTECPVLLATKKDDNNERKRIAESWSKQDNADIKPEDINCEGCLSEGGRVFSYCQVCEIRKCAQERHIDNCAYCNDYACEKLNEFFGRAPDAKLILEEIRKSY